MKRRSSEKYTRLPPKLTLQNLIEPLGGISLLPEADREFIDRHTCAYADSNSAGRHNLPI